MWYISLKWYLLHCVLQNDHSVSRAHGLKTYLRSSIGNYVSVTSHLSWLINIERTFDNSVVNKQWHGSYHLYCPPSKWQRQLFLLTCFMSHDRFISKNTLTSYVGLCCCIVWASFLFDCFVKIWATWKRFLGKFFPPPPPPPPSLRAKNCPYDYGNSHGKKPNFVGCKIRSMRSCIGHHDVLSPLHAQKSSGSR